MAGDTPKDPKLVLLGQHGVYLDQNPFQMPDGSWRRLQNGEFAITGDRTRGRAAGGIRKRGSLQPWSEDLGAEITAIGAVPLPSEMDFDPQLLLSYSSAAGSGVSWRVSTDGAAFTDLPTTTLPRMYENHAWAGITFVDVKAARPAAYRRNIYYPSNSYTPANPPNDPPPISVYTGDGQGYDVVDVPKYSTATQQPIAITDMIAANNLIYFTLFDQDAKARVLSLDPRSGAITTIGPELTPPSGSGMSLAYYQGRLWLGTYTIPGTAKGYIYSIRPGYDTAWTLERTGADHAGGYQQLIQYGVNLYALGDADASGTAIVEKRTPGGTWSTSLTAASSGLSRFAGAIVFGGNLYVGWWKPGATTAALIKKFDGTSWTTDLDIKSTYALKTPGVPVEFNGALYWPCYDGADAGSVTNFLLKRTSGGVWSQVLTGQALSGAAALWYPTPS